MGSYSNNSYAAAPQDKRRESGTAGPLAGNVAIRPQEAPIVSGEGSSFGQSSPVPSIRGGTPETNRPLSDKKPFSGFTR